jgi:hypothetical protein
MEGYMAEELPHRSERLRIDRRKLLTTSAAAITAANLAPNVPLFEDPVAVSAKPTSTASEAVLNVCANTARRFTEIERRNELRQETKLPLLAVAKTLRQMKEQDDRQKFAEAFGPFAAKHRQAVWDEVLKARREMEGPKWRPSWIEGMAYQAEVFRILQERFREDRTP